MDLYETTEKSVRPCGVSWAYCDGKCTGCDAHITWSTSTTVVDKTLFDTIVIDLTARNESKENMR